MNTTYPLPLDDRLMEEAKRAAREEGVTLDALLSGLISDGITRRDTLQALRARAKRGDPALALTILDRVPDVAPDENDAPEARR
jgi:predicted HAD superfamily phosphohydrolase